MPSKKQREYIIMDKENGHVLHDGPDRRLTISNVWNFLGLTLPDFIKMFFYCGVVIYFGTRFYLDSENMKLFIAEQTTINQHLTLCSDNRDKWATEKYGHTFTCGKPDDGWVPNFGNMGDVTRGGR